MASLNRVELIGTLADNPELRYAPSGRAVTFLTVNVESEEWRPARYVDTVTHTIPIISWGELGKACAKHLQKDSSIYVEGRLVTEKTAQTITIHDDELGEYEDEQVRSSAQVVARKIEFLNASSLEEPLPSNKEKIWEAIVHLETSVYTPNTDSGVLKALAVLQSIDLETIA
jgi:single stranded DNA-binding protein